jgi:phosphate uptake regulator
LEIRRVQKFGKSTLMVSLPAGWVKEVSLTPGENVYIEVDEDGSLKIYPPSMKVESSSKELKVTAPGSTMGELLARIVYATYITGYDKLTLESKDDPFSEESMKRVKEAVRSLIGLEIISQAPDSITVQSFLDPTKYTMSSLMLRMTSSLKQMLHYLSLGIKESSRTFLQEVIELEKEVDRLYFLALRQLILSQTNRTLAYVIGVKKIQIIGNRILVKAVEEAADEVSEAATDLLMLSPEELETFKTRWNEISMLIEQTSVIIDHATKMLSKEDIKLTNEVMEELRTMRRTLLTEIPEVELPRNGDGKRADMAMRLLFMRLYNSIRRMEPIAEISFNRALENLREIII